MFVVTPEGVIATDPIGERRPAAAAYIAEIRKITQAPIRYVVYSHSHYDHIAGGKPFKDLGSTFVSHWRTKQLLEKRNAPDIVIPDLVVTDSGGKLQLGGRIMADTYLPEQEDSMKKILAMDWDRLISGHPGLGGRQIGNKDDVKVDLDYMLDLSAAVKKATDEGKCYAGAIAEIKLPKWENLPGYAQNLPLNIERYCDYWNRGI
jgi:hypothetical protein